GPSRCGSSWGSRRRLGRRGWIRWRRGDTSDQECGVRNAECGIAEESAIVGAGNRTRRAGGPFRIPHCAFRTPRETMTSQQVELLAIAAHRDDVELTCGGTLAKAVRAGHRVGIVDLTQGETGTRGDATTRPAEAERATRALGVHVRLNAGLPDAHLQNDEPSRAKLIELIRATRARVVILPFPVGRHPDHRIASELGRDACYLAGLAKYGGAGGGGG